MESYRVEAKQSMALTLEDEAGEISRNGNVMSNRLVFAGTRISFDAVPAFHQRLRSEAMITGP